MIKKKKKNQNKGLSLAARRIPDTDGLGMPLINPLDLQQLPAPLPYQQPPPLEVVPPVVLSGDSDAIDSPTSRGDLETTRLSSINRIV
jgi:hypothetical protein